jgi:flagellar motility protein MotE (MotC chaperone)
MTYAILTSVLLLILCGWLWVFARDAEKSAEHWRAEAAAWRETSRRWRNMCGEAEGERDRAVSFARSAIDSIAARQEEMDRKDAEIERLRGACKWLNEQERYKHRLWLEARDQCRREPVVRRMVETIRRAQDMRRALDLN